ncbi:hypothetical protein TWF481_001728 [Arthrobotrys musiformis]|uniref:Uncharacterized protein n=1 Tax=Arthrobotrys musiformis TaxID=47236 RepID=A0AAV9VU93_9PEZI
MPTMLSTLARIGIFSISSLLLSGNFLNNHAEAFKIILDGQEASTNGYLDNLNLCNNVESGLSFFPPLLFAVPSPAVTCAGRGGLDNWVLEELEAFTSAYSYFSIRSYNGDYIVHKPISPDEANGEGHFAMRTGTPGVDEVDERDYVKSEFWIARGGTLQLINDENPVQDGDVIVFAGPGPQEPHTRFHLMRSPHARGLPANDYKYLLYSILPGDTTVIPADADILVLSMRIKLSNEFGEIIVGPLPEELIQRKPQASRVGTQNPPALNDLNIFANRKGNNVGQAVGGDDTGGLFHSESPNLEDELGWFPSPADTRGVDDLKLEDLRITRTSGKSAPLPGRNAAALQEAAKLLGLPVSNSRFTPPQQQQSDEQLARQLGLSNFRQPRERSRLPGEIGPPGTGIGAYNERNIIDNGRYYYRPPELSPDGEWQHFAPMALSRVPRLEDEDDILLSEPRERFGGAFIDDIDGYIPPDDDLVGLEPYADDLYYSGAGGIKPSDGYFGPGQIEDEIEEQWAGDIDPQSTSLSPDDIEVEEEEMGNQRLSNRALDDIKSDGYQYYQPEAVYIDENDEAINFDGTDDIDDPRDAIAMDSGSVGGIPASLFGQSSNSQDANSPYPFGTNQSPPSGNVGLGQVPPTDPLDELVEDENIYAFPPEILPNRANVNYNGGPLEKIEEEGSGESSSARIDDPGSLQLGMQYEDDGSNLPSSPDFLWGDREQIEELSEDEIGPGLPGYDEEFYGPGEAGVEYPEYQEGQMEYGEDEEFPLPEAGWEGNFEDIVDTENYEIEVPDENYGLDGGDEVQAMPGDESWNSTDRSYDSLLLYNWDKNGAAGGDGIPSSNIKGAVEMTELLEPQAQPPADPDPVGPLHFNILQDKPKKPRWWQRVHNKLTGKKPSAPAVVRGPTGFEGGLEPR